MRFPRWLLHVSDVISRSSHDAKLMTPLPPSASTSPKIIHNVRLHICTVYIIYCYEGAGISYHHRQQYADFVLMDTAEKRKLRDDDEEVDDGKKAKREDISGGGESAGASQQEEEEEVEEFFAILKRIRVAVKYFQKANKGTGESKPRMTNNEWKPSFLLQDFQGDNEVKDEEKPEDLGEDSGLDLNREPVSKEKLNETTD